MSCMYMLLTGSYEILTNGNLMIKYLTLRCVLVGTESQEKSDEVVSELECRAHCKCRLQVFEALLTPPSSCLSCFSHQCLFLAACSQGG